MVHIISGNISFSGLWCIEVCELLNIFLSCITGVAWVSLPAREAPDHAQRYRCCDISHEKLKCFNFSSSHKSLCVVCKVFSVFVYDLNSLKKNVWFATQISFFQNGKFSFTHLR